MNKPFNPDLGGVVPVAQDPFAYFSPLLTIGHLVVPLGTDLDNEEITRAVVAKEEDRRSEEVGDTKSEDSLLPTDHAEVSKLLARIDGFVRTLNPHFESFDDAERWGHILNPGQNTDWHTHIRADWPDGLSWVYYSNYPTHSGELVFVMDAVARRNMHEINPEVGNLVIFPSYAPHYTRRNMSEEKRVSISGNYFPDPDKADAYDEYASTQMTPLAHILGIWQG
ncbi:MAG: putative 2OG-Fe(II) oxygenase [Pseudomonadota bacterium]